MTNYLIAYVIAAVIFGVMDALWLNWAGPNLYRPVIGEIMAEDFNVGAAGAFYLLYLAGMMLRDVRSHQSGGVQGLGDEDQHHGYLLGCICHRHHKRDNDLGNPEDYKLIERQTGAHSTYVYRAFCTGLCRGSSGTACAETRHRIRGRAARRLGIFRPRDRGR